MKKKSISLIVALLIEGMLLNGCSNGTNQINNVETNSAESTKQETLKSNKLDSKLIELYQSTKEKQKENDERNVFGIDEAKFDKDGKLWVKCVEPGDVYREDQIMIENHVFTIYDSIDKHIQYWKEVGIKINTEQVVSNNCFKDVVGKPEESTLQEFQTIENEFESMKDCYDDLINSNNSLSTNFINPLSNNKENVEITKNVYYYFTNDGKELHLSSSKPTSNDYAEGQDDYDEIVNAKKSDDWKPIRKKIETVVIDDEIIPKTCKRWFYGFNKLTKLVNIEYLNTSLCNDMTNMFGHCTNIKKINLNNFNTYNVKKMDQMFSGCSSIEEIDLTSLKTDNVESMDYMFDGCESLKELDLSNFKTDKCETMAYMFSDCINLNILNLQSFHTSKVNSMRSMFSNCESLTELNLLNFDTTLVNDMNSMFYNCKNLKELDLSNFSFFNIKSTIEPGGTIVPDTVHMFDGCQNLRTIYSKQDVKIEGNYDIGIMFDECINLVCGNGTKYNDAFKDISFAIVDSDYQMGYFTYDKSKYYWENGKYYVNGNLQKNKWITDIENSYYLDDNGNTLKNQWKDGKYLGEDGKMLKNTYTPDNKYVNKDGNVVDLEKDFANIDKETVQLNAWYRTDNGVWYYFEGDRDTLKKGWFTDPQDNQTYYLDPKNGVMLTGWQTIDGNEYYFSTRSASEPNWYYVEDSDIWLSYGKKIKALGSMFRDEITPDGKRVDIEGKLQN